MAKIDWYLKIDFYQIKASKIDTWKTIPDYASVIDFREIWISQKQSCLGRDLHIFCLIKIFPQKSHVTLILPNWTTFEVENTAWCTWTKNSNLASIHENILSLILYRPWIPWEQNLSNKNLRTNKLRFKPKLTYRIIVIPGLIYVRFKNRIRFKIPTTKVIRDFVNMRISHSQPTADFPSMKAPVRS